jgi:galactokinase
MTKTQVIQRFRERYGEEPAFLVRAPGRVNLIGEHTDYNDGFVLPIAIDRAIWVALHPRPDRHVVAYSLDYDETIAFDLNGFQHEEAGWGEYVKGVAWALQEEGHKLAGWEGVIGGDVPRGAGLSSSAAVELAVAQAFAAASDLAWNPMLMARLGQRVENEWVGVNCGIMDQMVVASAQEGAALLIDCRTLDTEQVPLPEQTTVAVLDTGTRRGLVDSAYNERRAQCEQAARFFGVPALRDVDFTTFEQKAEALDAVARRRARHVITENARTLAAADALRLGDTTRVGALMNASHASLRDDFEVSSRELDMMADIAQAHPACYGARMTGAGFGGCGVALVDAQQAIPFAEAVAEEYRAQTDLAPQVYLCRASAGVQGFPHKNTDQVFT